MGEYNWTKVKNDINGNPKFVLHFLQMLSPEEMQTFHEQYGLNAISQAYAFACKRANSIGGRKYHNKSYGGGIVFQSYCLIELETAIVKMKGE